jgi:succinate dehydrogenase hydrophobic anchor subunit
VFMQLAPVASREMGIMVPMVQKYFIRAVYLLLLAGTLYHAGYGIWSLVGDYLSSTTLRKALPLLVTLVMLACGWVGFTMINSF